MKKQILCLFLLITLLSACEDGGNPITSIADDSTLQINSNKAMSEMQGLFYQIEAIILNPNLSIDKSREVQINETCHELNRKLNQYDRPNTNTLTFAQVTNEQMNAMIMLHHVCEMVVKDYRREYKSKELERNEKSRQENTPYRKTGKIVKGGKQFITKQGELSKQAIMELILTANDQSINIKSADQRCKDIEPIIFDFIKICWQEVDIKKISQYTFISLHGPHPNTQARHDTAITYEKYRDKFRSLQNQARILLLETGIRKAKNMTQ